MGPPHATLHSPLRVWVRGILKRAQRHRVTTLIRTGVDSRRGQRECAAVRGEATLGHLGDGGSRVLVRCCGTGRSFTGVVRYVLDSRGSCTDHLQRVRRQSSGVGETCRRTVDVSPSARGARGDSAVAGRGGVLLACLPGAPGQGLYHSKWVRRQPPDRSTCEVVYTGTLSDYRYDSLLSTIAVMSRSPPGIAHCLHFSFIGEGSEAAASGAECGSLVESPVEAPFNSGSKSAENLPGDGPDGGGKLARVDVLPAF